MPTKLEDYKERLIDKTIELNLKTFYAIQIVGPTYGSYLNKWWEHVTKKVMESMNVGENVGENVDVNLNNIERTIIELVVTISHCE